MRTRAKKFGPAAAALSAVIAIALLAILGAAAAAAAGRFGGGRALLAEPAAHGGAGISLQSIEDFREEAKILATYEIRAKAPANAVNKTHSMTVIGTNAVYGSVLGYPAIDGGFFTEAAFKSGAREAVLNRRAAASLFGGGNIAGSVFRLNGDIWTVAGVIIDDDAENANIYVPATSSVISGSDAGSAGLSAQSANGGLMILMGGPAAAGMPMTIALIKELGISESSYTFKNLGKAVDSFKEMAAAAPRFAMMLLLGWVAWRSARSAYRIFRREEKKNADAIKAVVMAAIALAGIAGSLYLIRQIVEVCVAWQEIPLLFLSGAAQSGSFSGRLAALAGDQLKVMCLFAASLAASATTVFLQEA